MVLLSAALSYWHLHGTIKRGISNTVRKYNEERAARESMIFELAKKNHQLLSAEIDLRLATGSIAESARKFARKYVRYPDGTTRNRREIFDGKKHAGIFIPPGLPITPERMHLVIVLAELAETYGKAFRSNFQDTYFTTPENIMVIFWPEAPNWALDMAPDFDMTKEEYVYIADSKHNPERRMVWTGLFFDKVAKVWMASGETPYYRGEKHLLTIGHDVMLSELTRRIESEGLDGAYSIVLRADGRLVAHAGKMTELIVSDGRYDIKKSGDQYLKRLYESVMARGQSGILEHPKNGDLLVYETIHGPEWLLVTVFPASLITADTLKGIGFVMALALLSLLLEMVFLYVVVEREVNVPLQNLSRAIDALRAGAEPQLEVGRTDELGSFAATFESMSKAIAIRDRQLSGYASSLEEKVRDRTQELERQRALSLHQSKMAALGEMAGGVAHEINNPLATITIISEQCQELLRELPESKRLIHDKLQIILTTAERIARIVRGLRSFSRAADQDPTALSSIKEIVEDTLSFCRERFAHHRVDLRIGALPDISIDCRRTEISQVLLNLLNNAFDATEEMPERWVELSVAFPRQGVVHLRVTDSGPGFSPEIADRIMEPFFTTKEVGRGTGLGLSISQGIAESHNGKLFVDHAVGYTCFVLELNLPR